MWLFVLFTRENLNLNFTTPHTHTQFSIPLNNLMNSASSLREQITTIKITRKDLKQEIKTWIKQFKEAQNKNPDDSDKKAILHLFTQRNSLENEMNRLEAKISASDHTSDATHHQWMILERMKKRRTQWMKDRFNKIQSEMLHDSDPTDPTDNNDQSVAKTKWGMLKSIVNPQKNSKSSSNSNEFDFQSAVDAKVNLEKALKLPKHLTHSDLIKQVVLDNETVRDAEDFLRNDDLPPVPQELHFDNFSKVSE